MIISLRVILCLKKYSFHNPQSDESINYLFLSRGRKQHIYLSSYQSLPPSQDATVSGARRDTNTESGWVGGRRGWWWWKDQHLFIYLWDDRGRAPAEMGLIFLQPKFWGTLWVVTSVAQWAPMPRIELMVSTQHPATGHHFGSITKEELPQPPSAVEDQGTLSLSVSPRMAVPDRLIVNGHVDASILRSDKECKCTNTQTVGAQRWCCKHILLAGSRPYAATALTDRIPDD